tara:strand:+ start:29480 stop:30460 length:981 start_codon:yes stop_codon:yes gene_type:complete
VSLFRTATAPGKVVLSGEYAVLDGAAAVCMAINRRARVSLKPAHESAGSVTAPGFNDAVGRFRIADGELHWLADSASFAVVDAAWQACSVRPAGAFDLVLDSSAFVDSTSGNKLGIGSSAAIVVALCAALGAEGGTTIDAFTAHRNLHGGSGSGVDVACSLHGDLLEYRQAEQQSSGLEWPHGLKFRLIWTGVAVSTKDKLMQLQQGASLPSRAQLTQAAESAARAWRNADAAALVEQYRDYTERLLHFSDDHRLGIFDAGHRELLDTASSSGLVYKPCGAGGGDIGIVLGTDDARLDDFVRNLPLQFSMLDCALDRDGLIIEEQT